VEVNGRTVTVGGIAKGVAMLEPHLATMFCFVATDGAVARGALSGILRRAVDHSFNRVTVDSDQSTSDTVALLANGLGRDGRGGRRPGPAAVAAGVEALMTKLAKMLVSDGEGATKLVAVTVRGAASRRDALIAARAVANSRWSRRRSTARTPTGPDHDGPRQVGGPDRPGQGGHRLWRGGSRRAGCAQRRRAPGAHPEIMGGQEFEITIDLGLGRAEDRMWTCDLSEEYVRLNGKYTT